MIVKFIIKGLTNVPVLQQYIDGKVPNEPGWVYRTVRRGVFEYDIVRMFVFGLARKLKEQRFRDFKVENSPYFIGQTRLFWNWLFNNWRRLVEVQLVKGDKLDEFIKKVGSKYQVQSRTGKNMGTYDSKKDAVKRLKQVEYFKNKDEAETKSSYQRFADMNKVPEKYFKKRKLTSKIDDLWSFLKGDRK